MIRLKVNKILKDKDKSIYWLAEKTNLTYPTLHRIANNQTEGIQFHTLEEIMTALDISDFNNILEMVPDKEK